MSTLLWLGDYLVVPAFLLFGMLLVITYWPSRRKTMDRDAAIPLRDDV